MDRPALKELFSDIEKGLIDIVVVYKVDRLSRSLMDFAKIVELFEKYYNHVRNKDSKKICYLINKLMNVS